MIVGVDTRTSEVRLFWGEAVAARAWCYLRRSRALYEIHGRYVTDVKPEVALARVLRDGRLLTTGRNAPTRHTSAVLRKLRDGERRKLRKSEVA